MCVLFGVNRSFLYLRSVVLLLLMFLLNTARVVAQTYEGMVVDHYNRTLEFVTISAYTLPDTVFVQGCVTDSNGEYTLQVLDTTKPSFLKFSMIGYHDEWRHINDAKKVILSENVVELQGVEISALKSSFSKSNGNIVGNVGGTVLQNETDVKELLGKMPSLFLKDGEITSLSKGAVIYYINSRPATSIDVDQLDIATIKSVEINNHAGARYGENVGTVITIHTTKALDGFSVQLRTIADYGRRFSSLSNLQTTYKYKKVAFTVGVDYSDRKRINFQNYGYELLSDTEKWEIYSDIEDRSNHTKGQIYNVGLDYDIALGHLLRVGFRHQYDDNRNRFTSRLKVVDDVEINTEALEAIYDATNRKNHVNLFYEGKLGNRWLLEFASDYFFSKNKNNQLMYEPIRESSLVNDGTSSLIGVSPKVRYNINNHQNILFGVDWTKSQIQRNTIASVSDIKNSDQKIVEEKRAAFIDYRWASGNNLWYANVGLRYENIDSENRDRFLNNSTKLPKYNKLLPSISLAYGGKLGHTLSFYTTSKGPSFSQLEPYEVYVNKYMYRVGNPKLRREINYNLNYALSYKFAYLSAEYSHIKNSMQMVSQLETEGDYSRIRTNYINLDKSRSLQLIASLSPKFKLYSPMLTVGYIKNWATIPNQAEQETVLSKPFFIMRWSNTFSLPHDWLIQAGFDYNGKGNNGYIVFSSTYGINLSIQKYFLNKRLQITLKGYDLLKSTNPKLSGSIYDMAMYANPNQDRRRVQLNLVWRFNSYKEKQGKSAIKEELNRL